MPGTPKPQKILALALALALVTFFSFRGVLDDDFVSYDDPDYVTANAQVQAGLTLTSFDWAFSTGYAGNWHPLTWLSHMSDVQLHGLKPWGHHLTSLLLHCANAVLVLLLLHRLTGAMWRSAIVAALFALHPLRVESVAWVAERKDVLCGFFFLLSLLIYVKYVSLHWDPPLQLRLGSRQSKVSNPLPSSILHPLSSRWYWLALLFFALALMSKPMAVTLPFVLLLLDLWPLGRAELSTFNLQTSTLRQLLLEKIPFFGLALASCVVTFLVQQRGGAMTSTAPLLERLANALVAYGRYLAKTIWPENLAVFYPYPSAWPIEWVVGSAVVLLGVSGLAVRQIKSRPALAVGWFWFLGTLVPTIGLVQVGGQSMADRYTYLPQIGLFVAVIFSVPVPSVASASWRMGFLFSSVSILAALAWQTTRQIIPWRDTESLFRHALAVTERNEVAHNNLGVALQMRGEWAAAKEQYAAALQIKSRYADAHMNLGNCLVRLGDPTNALEHLQRALELTPTANAHYNLGTALMELGRHEEARESLRRAVALDPAMPAAQLNLGITETALGDAVAGATACRAALALRANWPEAWLQLGNALGAQKDFAAAAEAFTQSARLNERDTTALFNLANAEVQLGKISEATVALNQLLRLNPADLESRRLLANLLLRQGDATGAVSEWEQIVRAAPGWASHLEFAQGLLAAGRRADAIAQYREVLRLQPELPAALNDLAWLLATHPDAASRNGVEAVTFAEKACAITQRKSPLLLGTLAAAYAEAGRFPDAIKSAEEAIAIAKAAGLTAIVERNEELLKLYRAGQPYHEPAR